MRRTLLIGVLVVGATVGLIAYRALSADTILQPLPASLPEVPHSQSGQSPAPSARSVLPVSVDVAGATGLGVQEDERGPAWIELAALSDPADRDRLAKVNRLLTQSGRPEISSRGRVKVQDLPAVRSIVDDAIGRLNKAEDAYLLVAGNALRPLKRDLMERVQRGERDGLPVRTKENNARRRHPHEAVSIVMHEGVRYVVRAGLDTNPELGVAGASVDSERLRALSDFDSVLRAMIVSPR
ncbi:MAG: hypothetical protein ACK501_20405 [Planctomycetota bacterium]|jgi:hypothetical protein